jgi:heme/copper-type cytochrome/quinol oxidase subunit 2
LNDNLQATLNKMIQSGSRSNPAMNTLINDYTKYHVVLVVAGGFLVVIFVLLSIFFWTQWRRVPKTDKRKWTFEKKTYFSFGALSAVVGLLIALIVAVNATNALDPQHGFSLLVDSLGAPKAGTQMDKLYQAFNTWVESGSTNIPPIIQRKIDERIAFHTTKAIVSGILLVVFVVLSTCIWSTLIKRSRVREAQWRLKERTLLVSGVATVTLSLLLMVIVVANMQGAFAPITLTLLYG